MVLAKEDYDELQENLAIYSPQGILEVSAESIIEASNSPKEDWINHEEFWKD